MTIQLRATTHRSPGDGGIMPCCRRTPFEVARWHRMTLDPEQVSCGRSRVIADVSWRIDRSTG